MGDYLSTNFDTRPVPRPVLVPLELEPRIPPSNVAPDHRKTTTPGTAAARVVAAPALNPFAPGPPASAAVREPSTISVSGLGPLPSDPVGLHRQLSRVVRGRGLRATRRTGNDLETSALLMAQRAQHTHSPASAARAQALLARIPHLKESLRRLQAEQDRVRTALQPALQREAGTLLDASEARISKIRAQYFSNGHEKPRALKSLRTGAQALVAAKNQVSVARGLPEGPQKQQVLHAAEQDYRDLHQTLTAQHRILASYDLKNPDFQRLEDLAQNLNTRGRNILPRSLGEPVRGMLDQAEGAIQSLRTQIEDDPSAIWSFEPIVKATLIRLGIPQHSMIAAHARDIAQQDRADTALQRTLISVVAMGLGVAAALPTGGTSLAVAAGVTASLDAYQLYLAVDEYRLADAAAHTDLDARRALGTGAPGINGLLLEAAGAAISVGGAGLALKASIGPLLGRADDVGDLARGLESSLGLTRSEALVAGLSGHSEDLLLLRDVAPEVWVALSNASPATLTAVVKALSPEKFARWAQKLGAQRFAHLVDTIPAAAWNHLLSTPVQPSQLALLAETLSPRDISTLAAGFKGQGTWAIAERAQGAQLHLADDGFVVLEGHIRVQPHQLQRMSHQAVRDLRADWANLLSQSEAASHLQQVTPQDLNDFRKWAKARVEGKAIDVKKVQGFAKRLRAEPKTVHRILDDLADIRQAVLPKRLEALAEAAPDLREGLKALHLNTKLSTAVKKLAIKRLEAAVHCPTAHFDRDCLADFVQSLVHDIEKADDGLRNRLLELEYGLQVVKEGRVMPGSTIAIGLGPKHSVELSVGGPRVRLASGPGDWNPRLQDLDVVYLDTNGVVQAVEVKRSDITLWKQIESKKGKYLDKFVEWRELGRDLGQTREVSMVMSQGESAALDTAVSGLPHSPRTLLENSDINYTFGFSTGTEGAQP